MLKFGMANSNPLAVIVHPIDDDIPRCPDPAEDSLSTPQFRRYVRSLPAYTEGQKPLPVVVHG